MKRFGIKLWPKAIFKRTKNVTGKTEKDEFLEKSEKLYGKNRAKEDFEKELYMKADSVRVIKGNERPAQIHYTSWYPKK